MTRSGIIHRYHSPLRYPGGKGKIANYVKLLLLENDLVGTEYVEPFAGGASVALSLLYEDYAAHVHINDLNAGVHAFWDAALNQTDELCDIVLNTPATIETWHEQRAILESPCVEPLPLGFATFFLNRVNRSGIIGGGVIGGIGQDGPYKIDARYNVTELVRRIRKVGRFRSRISLTNLDALEFLEPWTSDRAEPSFLYLDPPYFVKGSGLYDNFYNAADHAALAAKVHQLAQPWIVSYDAVPQIYELYTDAPSIRYALHYSASSQPSLGSEVMYFGPGIRVPEEAHVVPGGVHAYAVSRAQGAVWRDKARSLVDSGAE